LSYQSSWQEKVKRLPDEIFHRLEKTNNPQASTQRALLIGQGVKLFLPGLNNFISTPEWKLFISQAEPCHKDTDIKPDHLEALKSNPIYLKGDSISHITSFPSGTFDLIISLWDLPAQTQDNGSYAKNIHRLLKKKGQFCIFTYIDGSPELPLNIIKKIIERNKLPLKIFKSALPDSPKSLRRILSKADFGDVRIWKDDITCTYQSSEDLLNDIFSDNEKSLFMDNTTIEQRLIIREEFVKDIREHSFPLKISYDFSGGVGVKP